MAKIGRNLPENPSSDPTDHLVISLRSYVTRPPKADKISKAKSRFESSSSPKNKLRATDTVLIFDCETSTTPDQRLRFGNYQLRLKGQVIERGVFYQPGNVTEIELATIRKTLSHEEHSDQGPPFRILTRHEFVADVLYARGQKVGSQIVGFNLPFDISRLAVRHVNARGYMKGGFSFILIPTRALAPIVVATHSTTLLAALGQFAKSKAAVMYVDRAKTQLRAEPFTDVLRELSACLGGHALMGPYSEARYCSWKATTIIGFGARSPAIIM